MKRRDFIQKSAVITAGSMFMPAFLKALQKGEMPNTDFKGKRLIVIQLSGGNDGLNTVIPYTDDLYYQKRPRIAIPAAQAIKLNENLGLHPALEALRALWDEGYVNVINSVGYPNPDRSHFRSMDIWQTASDSDEYLSSGWLGRYLDSFKAEQKAHHALEIDDQLSLALKGNERYGFAMSNPEQLYKNFKSPIIDALMQHHHSHEHHEHVSYLYRTLNHAAASAEYLHEKSKIYRSNLSYPNTEFGKDLKQVAELIISGCDSQIYYLNLDGFDTHAGQNNRQQNLLKQYADAISIFTKDLKRAGLWNDCLIMTFSEFGRRVAENGSQGTDHGTANNLFLMGGSLKKAGFFNEAPDLSDLDSGDLKYKIDFRSVYTTILNDWLESGHESILGKKFEKLDFL